MKRFDLRWSQIGDEGEDVESTFILGFYVEVERIAGTKHQWSYVVRQGKHERSSGKVEGKRRAKLHGIQVALMAARMEVDDQLRKLTPA